MGKITHRGLLPPDDPMFSTGPEVFSRPASTPSSSDTPKSKDAVMPSSNSATDSQETNEE